MKKFVSLMLVVVMILLMITPVLASEPEYPANDQDPEVVQEDPAPVEEPVTDEPTPDDEPITWVDYFIFHDAFGRPTSPISLMMDEYGFQFGNLREAAYALNATVEWDAENQLVRWSPVGGGRVLEIVFGDVGGFNENGTIWVPVDFLWEVFFLTQDRSFGPIVRDDIPYNAPVTRTTDHGQMAVEFIQFMSDNLYNRVPFSYRELETAQWIRSTLIDMGYDESAVVLQTYTIEDLMNLQTWFWGAGLWMYEEFNAFDPDGRMTRDEAIDAIVAMMIEQEHEWIALTAEQMGISFEEAKALHAESWGMFVDMFDKFVESSAREMAPWQLWTAEVFGIFDPDTLFRPMSQNVILTIPGQSERTIIVTAHYCSIMVPGASDNASGTALLLESAYRMLDVDNYFTIVYVFMGAEEIGIYGAFYYVESLTLEERNNIVLNINADVLFEGPYFFFGAGVREDGWWLTDNAVTQLVVEVAEMLNETYGTVLINAPALAEMPSDQLAFLGAGHTVTTLVGLAREGGVGYEEFFGWMYPGFTSTIVHTDQDCFHYISERWPNKIGDAMWTFSLFLDYLLVAEFDYQDLPQVGVIDTSLIPDDVDLSGHPLVGTWAWDDDTQWTFVFNADGTGYRGLPGEMVEFTWYAGEFDLFIVAAGSNVTEFWHIFVVYGDDLTLALQWRAFNYTRQ